MTIVIYGAGIGNDGKVDHTEMLPWPTRSTDLYPTENVWAYVKSQLGAMRLQFEHLEHIPVIEFLRKILLCAHVLMLELWEKYTTS